MEENLIEEKSEKSQFLERLSICLRIIAIVSFIIKLNQPRNANHYRQHGLD